MAIYKEMDVNEIITLSETINPRKANPCFLSFVVSRFYIAT